MTDETHETYEDKFYNASPKMVEQAKKWADQFTNVPQQLLTDLIEAKGTYWEDLCQPLYRVSCKMLDNDGECSFIQDISKKDIEGLYDNNKEEIFEDCGESNTNDEESFASCDPSYEREDNIPMWGTLFQPPYGDRDWFRDMAQTIYEETGVLVYENEHYDILLGINSCGHCFYQSYWIPLYKLRGLKWHE